MENIFSPMRELEGFAELQNFIKKDSGIIAINGPSGSQKAHLVCAVADILSRKAVLVAHNELSARRLYEDLAFFAGDEVLLVPHIEMVLHDIEAESLELQYDRMEVIDRIISGDYRIIIASTESLLRKTISKKRFLSNILEINLMSKIVQSDIIYKLSSMGFQRVKVVEGKGQFTVRGGIIDVFPINEQNAVRIELFDEVVDSIRSFDISSQRSIENLDNLRIIPAREIIYSLQELDSIVEKIESELRETVKKWKEPNSSVIERLKFRIEADIERFKNEYYFAGIEKYSEFISDMNFSIIELLNKNTLIFADEPQKISAKIDTMLYEHYENCTDLMQRGIVLPSVNSILFEKEEILKKLKVNPIILLNSINVSSAHFLPEQQISIASKPMQTYNSRFDIFFEDVRMYLKKGKKVVLLCGPSARAEKFAEILKEQEFLVKVYQNNEFIPEKNIVSITHGTINEGFEYIDNNLVFISDRELFGEDKKIKKHKFKGSNSKKINAFSEIDVGDYVVHYSHGIGQYIGIENLSVDGTQSDYLKIRYIDGAYLYVPVSQLDLVQKYIGAGDGGPKLSRLGSGEWSKAKSRVKESLKEVANELIKIYAERESVKGHKFLRDTVWQKQMEEMFPYEETSDQLKCIEEIKQDMESDKPMDRLLCGDVGFGKTEVALRALFKAVMDGKQVAYLVPTTVLAFQQYTNFKQRLKDFPVSIELLSRFKTKPEQTKILSDARKGLVDIIVGTHRIVQSDIKFKDLGLLIVDEEQRFGVKHKERLKQLKANVDVLTLTATPIPRTLHMSLVGIRDISVIEEAPQDRHPVQTYVLEYNEDVVREAIEREVSRGGQIFYLYNNIRTIEMKILELSKVVPGIKIEIAHGQMSKNRLEDVMQDFLDKKFDMLLCSTIIESGLDFPNVNTIIVEESDKLGLAQLYQIRGRVGRSNKIAYAYLTFKRDKILSEIAEKRLSAIREFTELGSGFKIALRDLEIRGSGNLLGSQQHGHMDAVGYDMYMRLLSESVKELSGEISQAIEEVDVKIDFNLDAYINSNYISDEVLRLTMYKKIAAVENEDDYRDIIEEFVDRFGDIPPETANLIDIAYIRSLAKSAMIESITQRVDNIYIQFYEGVKLDFNGLFKIIERHRKKMLLNASSKPYLTYKIRAMSKNEILQNIKIILQDINNIRQDK